VFTVGCLPVDSFLSANLLPLLRIWVDFFAPKDDDRSIRLTPGEWHGLYELLACKSNHSKNNIGMKITSKGQVTIPQDLRERFGLLPNTEVEFVPTADGRELRLLKSAKSSGRGRALVERLRDRGTSKLSTDELLKMMRSEP